LEKFLKNILSCGLYEAQDVLIDIYDVDLLCLDMTCERWFAETPHIIAVPMNVELTGRRSFAR
jgi:hypothetical protein